MKTFKHSRKRTNTHTDTHNHSNEHTHTHTHTYIYVNGKTNRSKKYFSVKQQYKFQYPPVAMYKTKLIDCFFFPL